MIYSQFQSNSFPHRFSGARGILAFVLGITVISLSLLALPFILLFGAISFIAVSLMARFYMKRKVDQFKRDYDSTRQHDAYAAHRNVNPEAEPDINAIFDRDSFKPRPHKGRTFEHHEL